MQNDNQPNHSKYLRTQSIFKLSCPYANQYQGNALHHLFVCSAGLLRSPTAANVSAKLGYNSRSCGSANYALISISVNLVHWADVIYFMQEENYLQALDAFDGDMETQDMIRNKAIVWEIEDHYDFGDPWLTGKITELLT